MAVMPPAEARFAPQHFTGFMLRKAYVVSRQSVEACIGEDSTIREVPALTLVGQAGAMSQRRLGDLLDLNRTTVVKLVDALEAKGWLERVRDEHDRRSYALSLTAGGQQALGRLHHALDRGEQALTHALQPVELVRLTGALRALLGDDTTLEIAGLGDRCGYLIARAHRLMFRRAVAALEPLGLTPRDFGVLTALAAAEPCSQQTLAGLLGVSAPAVLGFLDDLEAVGLVARKRNKTDRRAYDLNLTPAGLATLRAARGAASELQDDLVRTLSASTDEDLRSLLGKIVSSYATATPLRLDRPLIRIRPVEGGGL